MELVGQITAAWTRARMKKIRQMVGGFAKPPHFQGIGGMVTPCRPMGPICGFSAQCIDSSEPRTWHTFLRLYGNRRNLAIGQKEKGVHGAQGGRQSFIHNGE